MFYDATTGELLSPGIEAEYQAYLIMGGTQEAFWLEKNASGVYVTDIAPGGAPSLLSAWVPSSGIFPTQEAAFFAAGVGILAIFMFMRYR